MAYDGRLLRLAQERYEADRSVREADLAEQREQLYARRPRLREIQDQLRRTASRVMAAALRRGEDPLPEIQRLIAAQLETRDVRAMYDGFCAMQERAVISALERAAAQAGGDRSDMALRVAAEANVGKMIAEKIMDVHFPAPSREKKREKE